MNHMHKCIMYLRINTFIIDYIHEHECIYKKIKPVTILFIKNQDCSTHPHFLDSANGYIITFIHRYEYMKHAYIYIYTHIKTKEYIHRHINTYEYIHRRRNTYEYINI